MCPPQLWQRHSRHPKSPSKYNGWMVLSTLPGMVSENEGQPVPLSNFEAAGISGVSHAAQLYVPVLGYCLSRGELPARSVPRPTSTSKDSGESCAFHSALVFLPATSPTGTFWLSSHRAAHGHTNPTTRRVMSEASSGPGTALAITRVCAILAATDLALCGLIKAEDAMQEALRMAYWSTLLVLITLVCVCIPQEGATARAVTGRNIQKLRLYIFLLK
mmetsp:Transcript_12663/g.21454  ORF Transcript_12663/g.21454 Transcript_12663/m.21454 type:complete len:218 (-) Transcript_12663:78-731(-)